MVAQITLFSTPLPNTYDQTAEEFEASANTLVSELNPAFLQANALALEVNELALNAEAAAGELANTAWVSGTTYTAGQVRYSPIDSLMYRRKTNGAGTTDPSLDTTNWALQTKTVPGGSDTSSNADDIALTSTSGRLQIIGMTSANKKVTLPSANTLAKGVPLFVLKNSGNYRFSVHKNGGVFICYINPGQVVSFGCSDISTAAGVWAINGEGIETIYSGNSPEVLNSVDSRFISVAMLSATKAICAFKNNSTGFLEAVILNFGSESGDPLPINGEAVRNISIAALSSSKSVVVYQLNAVTTIKGYVLDVSGNTITPGTVRTIVTNASNGTNGISLCALSSTQLLCLYFMAGATTPRERILDISGSTIAESGEVVADTSSIDSLSAPYLVGKSISSSKALLVFVGPSSQTTMRLQSVTGSTPAPTGSVLSISQSGGVQRVTFIVCIMNANRAVIIKSIDRTYGDAIAYIVDISGTTPVLITSKQITLDLIGPNANLSAAKLDSSRIYLTWTGGGSLGVDSLVLTLTSDDRIVLGKITERHESGVTESPWYLACDALDASHVMQVSRNASTFLSAKTIEIS
ncbi:MAG: hypothetical protein K2Q14_07035 [Gammaproteobacteria bacterium]|nr:hypothetical protein [Nitrosomonas sp.]MBY0545282.1 hypothetical protein [Gammaproteobacteria bacterium]